MIVKLLQEFIERDKQFMIRKKNILSRAFIKVNKSVFSKIIG